MSYTRAEPLDSLQTAAEPSKAFASPLRGRRGWWRVGFEPYVGMTPTGLQPVPFSHSGTLRTPLSAARGVANYVDLQQLVNF